ncbi:MAG: alkaline phosphatase family protein, partial [Pseudomonadota bacterium]
LVPLGGHAPLERTGSSLAALTGDTVADALVAARPSARVFSFSLKDRGALFGGGRRPELTLWLDTECGTFVTSTAFTAVVPAWVAPFGDAAALTRGRGQAWQPLDAAWLAVHAETPDDQVGEGDYLGLGVAFPHRATSVKAQRATPLGDQWLFGLAGAAAARAAAGPRDAPVLLALSLSSNDYIAHVFGPNSWEVWDELLRLDRGLAELLVSLDGLVGPNGYAVMLTGDHGSNPLPEIARAGQGRWCHTTSGAVGVAATDVWQRPCGQGRRLAPREIADALEGEARALFGGTVEGGGDAKWIAGVSEPFVYFSPRGRALSPADRAALLGRAEALLRQRYDVARVVDVRDAPAACPPEADDSLAALICRSIRRDQRGDFYVVPAPGTFFDAELTDGGGTSHGSPYLYDRAVPLLVRAPGRIPAGAIESAPVSFSAFARTAAVLLGVPPPAAAAAGRDLTSSSPNRDP